MCAVGLNRRENTRQHPGLSECAESRQTQRCGAWVARKWQKGGNVLGCVGECTKMYGKQMCLKELPGNLRRSL